ncbi:MAG: glucoamylase family protein [Terriglobia bacterium]
MNNPDEVGNSVSIPPPTSGCEPASFVGETEIEKQSPDADSKSVDLAEPSAWEPALSSRKGYRLLREGYLKAFRSVKKTERWLRKLISEGRSIPSGIHPLALGAPRIRSAFRDTREALNGELIRKLPRLRSRPDLPRVYVLVRDFLQAVHFTFEEEVLRGSLDGAQQKWPLEIDEIWAVKPLLQLALLEEIARQTEPLREATESRSFSRSPAAVEYNLKEPITSLQTIEHTDWGNLFDQVSRTEKILREDQVYSQMTPETRDMYRKEIVKLAAHSRLPEVEIPAAAVRLAREAIRISGEDARFFERRKHVGFYLVSDGRKQLEQAIGYRPPLHQRIERIFLRSADAYYVIAIELVTISLIAFLMSGLHLILPIFAAVVLLLLPATESAMRIVNQLASFLVRPRLLPKMDFGIPADCTTMVVVPTLLISEKQVRETVEELEVRYLANASPHLHFALLTDSPDSFRPFDEKDELVGLCAKLIEDLNGKYRDHGNGSFFLFHRHRVYNPSEGAWMGWERKRGKLLDLNNLLRHNFDSFPVKIGDLNVLPRVRYVITLDSDTKLPRDTAQQLVGTLAHPLNRAIIDPETNTVVKGYGILQPRVGISVQSVARSRLASIYSGQTGFDLYTHAVSDVYQDVFGEGSYTGKGIYEVDVYQKVLGQRFPANALLSHDLVEGSYARAGLVSEIEVIDDYPSHFSAYSRRKHRWVRGDWQILRWLLNHVPDYSGKPVPNPLSFLSRWKILDNLRRSLIEAATLALLLGGWFYLPGGAAYWTVATLILLLIPSYLQLFLSAAVALGSGNWKGYLHEAAKGFVNEQVGVLFVLVFLLHQSLVTLDAIVRTLVRLAVTHKKFLEWETAAQAELKSKKQTPVDTCLDWTPWLSVGLGVALAFARPAALPVALPFLAVWFCSKLIRDWMDRPLPPGQSTLAKEDRKLLARLALQTWRFFQSYSEPEGLAPDNVQEAPPSVAKIISPTNLGVLLDARLAAYDLGYLTVEEFAKETGRTLNAAERLPRYKGHFLNWYDIQKMEPVAPLFVSTVDSGNLAACLWTLKQGCLEMIRGPLFQPGLWQGFRHHVELLQEFARQAPFARSDHAGVRPALNRVTQRFELLGEDPGAWISNLQELEQSVAEIRERMITDNGRPENLDQAPSSGSLRSPSSPQASGSEQVEGLRPSSSEEGARGRRAGEGAVSSFAASQAGMSNSRDLNQPEWWAAELHRRIVSLKSMAEHFAPWLLPEHQPLFSGLAVEIKPARLTLQALPQLLATLEEKARSIAEQDDQALAARSFLESIRASARHAQALLETLRRLAKTADSLVTAMDFRFLHNPARKLLSIGYNVTAQRVEKACYDILASEARTAVFIAVAKGDIRQESWFRLGRQHSLFEGERVLLSWSGTMFEYLMPSLWMRSYPDTILAQTQRAVVRCQQKFGRRKRRPWGVSEAAYGVRDDAGHYQYQAFGIPALALSAQSTAEVVAPYATFLALGFDATGAVKNLRRMMRLGCLSPFGFYESVDYDARHYGSNAPFELIRSWMAHHQGMSFLAVSNLLAPASLQRRFHAEPRVQATEPMLHERVPATVPVLPAEEPIEAAESHK